VAPESFSEREEDSNGGESGAKAVTAERNAESIGLSASWLRNQKGVRLDVDVVRIYF